MKWISKKGSLAAKDNMPSDQWFVTAICGNITISRTVLVSNCPYKRDTKPAVGNTVNNSQIQGIIIQSFMDAFRKADAENEVKSINEMDMLDNLLMCSALCSLAQIFSFCISPANCIWAQKGAVAFIQLHNQKNTWLWQVLSLSPSCEREVPELGKINSSEKTNLVLVLTLKLIQPLRESAAM